MTKTDIILAAICGLSLAWVSSDFFRKFGYVFLFVLPALFILALWIADAVGNWKLFVRQAAKFVMAGTFADVVDIKVFQLLIIFAPLPLVFKAISFFVGTFIKYWCDKYWTFEKKERAGMTKEMVKFFMVAIMGALINVVSFYYFSKIRTVIPASLWTELSIILAAITAGLWNFLGYKFLVFKK